MVEEENKCILFISHEATRTGAPIALLHMLRWLQHETDWEIHILLLTGGELEADFRAIGETHLWEPPLLPGAWPQRWQRLKELARVPYARKQKLLARFKQISPAIIYANSVVSLALGVELKRKLGARLVSHIHELNVLLQKLITPRAFAQLASHVDVFVTVSQAAKSSLVHAHGIPQAKVTVLFACIDSLEAAQYQLAGRSLRAALGIPPDVFVVLSSGSLNWNKSPDLFVQVALQATLTAEDMPFFIWLGGRMQEPIGRELEHDIACAGLGEHIRFIDTQPNPQAYMSMCDLFMLPSREDSFGLVGLEAASLGKPVLCFEGGGGMPEFVEQDAGLVIPYLRTDLMAQAILTLQANPAERFTLGNQAAKKQRQQHATTTVLPQLDVLLRRLVQATR